MAEHQLQLGIGHACWSPDSRFLVTINANQPHSVWVWDMATMELSAVLSHQQAVKDMQWAPQ
ncbi:WD_REPEATS_REGION domain-containing protein, partial [Haematococcus lacustris]